ncbi:MAG: cytochrome c biogenesis protein CcsA [Saprospirales bacterium]|nr:cytochrome c biogenesis protein CcsA [Saprospirales bacterium]
MLLEIQYIGEHLLPGKLGHLAVLLSFVAGLLASISYLMRTLRPEERNWLAMGRWSFGLHAVSVFAIIGVIFFIMANQYYEYQYVFAHVNEDLPQQYILSAFWEGQEGSFLLWMFWHAVLGLILMRTGKQWESPVLFSVALVQVFIASMLLGIFSWGDDPFKLGSNPFMLLRDAMDAPIFAQADYLAKIQGNGLNPLLQNYWMTIHPPTLFLGFASVTIPFAFALAGLITGKHQEWLRPALPWALFSGAILGLGILMGGAWAYEALSFGGYWAWDPVENMSLVPWLVLIAGIHTNLVARNTGYSIKGTYFFYLLSFLLVLYSTFLTRSGVLGSTSVHAFTEMGLEWMLVGFISVFALLGFIPLIWQSRHIPSPNKEEPLASKEFWMFIGTLILFFSAAMITASTSLPVYNKIRTFFDPEFVGRVITDAVPHYNKYQLWIGTFIGLFSGAVQFLRWKEVNWKKNASRFFTHIGIAALGAAALTALCSLWIHLHAWQYVVLLFFGLFTLFSNLDYLIFFIKGNIKAAGSTISHIGFGVMIVGILASGLNKQHISTNPFAQRGLIDEERLDRNIMLFKDMPMYMSGYRVTYLDDAFEGNNRKYSILFENLDTRGQAVKTFTLQPTALYDNKMQKVAAYNPSTKHYLSEDIFTHIASIPMTEADVAFARENEDSLKYQVLSVNSRSATTLLDTVFASGNAVVREFGVRLEELVYAPTHPSYEPEKGDLTIGARLAITDIKKDTTFYAEPMLVLRGALLYTYPVHIQPLALKVRLREELVPLAFPLEEDLNYEELSFKQGDRVDWNGYQILFKGFDKAPRHPNYQKEETDIAVGAMLEVTGPGLDSALVAEPIFLIRDNQPFNFKDQILSQGLHFRFTRIDPVTETVVINIAQQNWADSTIPVEVAYAPRTDFLVLEAIIFPGINLFWLGSLLLLAGLLLSMWNRLRNQPVVHT